jgi:hypothetical protein
VLKLGKAEGHVPQAVDRERVIARAQAEVRAKRVLREVLVTGAEPRLDGNLMWPPVVDVPIRDISPLRRTMRGCSLAAFATLIRAGAACGWLADIKRRGLNNSLGVQHSLRKLHDIYSCTRRRENVLTLQLIEQGFMGEAEVSGHHGRLSCGRIGRFYVPFLFSSG